MDFSLDDEQRAVGDTAWAFIRNEVMALEPEVLRRERAHRSALDRAELRDLQLKARAFGYWGAATPEEFGGMGLPAVMQSLLWTEIGRTWVPFRFGGEAGNILFRANVAQRAEYLVPTIEGERISCFAITEPNAGSNAANITMAAVRSGADWVLRGGKTFITNGNEADFAIVIAHQGTADRALVPSRSTPAHLRGH